MPNVVSHGQTHRPHWVGGSDPMTAVGYYEIKVFADAGALDAALPATATNVTAGDGKFIFAIPEDLDGSMLVTAHAYVTAVGGCTVQIRNVTQGHDMLTTKITIDATEFTSYDAAVQPVINPTNADVETGDLISIDVDDPGAGTAQGLGVILVFAAV